MADIYDVNAAIQKPNMLAAVQQGYGFGTQQRQVREEEQRQNRLRGLAPGILAGDPAAFNEAAAIDPVAATQTQQAGDSQLRRLKGFIDYVDQARSTGNVQAVNAALRQGAPFLSQITGGRPPPTEWTPDMDAGWEQLKAKVAVLPMDQANEPAGYRQAHLTAIAAGYQPGTPEYQRAMQVAAGTAPRAIPPGYTTRSYRDANGQEVVELVQIRGEGAGQQMPAGQSAPQPSRTFTFTPAPGAENAPAAAEFQSLSPDQQQAAAALVEQGQDFTIQGGRVVPSGLRGGQPMGTQAPVPGDLSRVPINAMGGGPVAPFAGSGRGQTDADRARAAAEQAAMVERAKLGAQLEVAPRQAAAEADAARQKKEAEAQAERNATAQKRGAQAAETVSVLNDAIRLLPQATGGIAGQVRDAAGRVVNQSTEGSRATARLKLLAAKLVANVPRFEGPQSNIDVQFYREAAGDLANPNLSVGERQAAAELMLEIAQRYANPAAPNQPASGGQAPQPAGGRPPVPGARQAPDGNWYVNQGGQFFKVEP